MEDPNDDTEVELRITHLIQGGEADRNKAFQLIHRHFMRPLCGAARRHNSRIDLVNLWGQTLAWFNSHSKRIDYDDSRSPIPLLRTFIVCRAIEDRRKGKTHERVLEELAYLFRDTQTGAWWQSLSVLERQDVFKEIDATIDNLPPRQRQVWRVFVHAFPESQNMSKLRALVEKLQGSPVSLASVERALQEGRRKIRAAFAEIGYTER